jgi:selenocysteine lyase/cysteine desulfurase
VALVRGLGVEAIRAHVDGMAAALKRELAAISGVTVLSPDAPAASSGIVTFEVAGARGDRVAAALWESRKIVTRPALAFGRVGCRVSVAFFTTEDELAMLLDAARGIARKRG